MLLLILIKFGLLAKIVDVNATFLGELEEEIYMENPSWKCKTKVKTSASFEGSVSKTWCKQQGNVTEGHRDFKESEIHWWQC